VTLARRIALTFGAILLAAGTIAATVWRDNVVAQEAAAWTEHTLKVLDTASRMTAAVVDQETGLRAFLLSGQAVFLEPFLSGRSTFLPVSEQLLRLTADNPAQQMMLKEALQHAEAWARDHADPAIALVDLSPGNVEEARSMEASGNGKAATDAFRAAMDRFRQSEIALLASYTEARDAAQAHARATLLVGGPALALCSLLLGVWLYRSVAMPLTAMTAAMRRLARGDCTVRIPARDHDDELGAMSEALQIFRETTTNAVRLVESEARERAMRLEALASSAAQSSTQVALLETVTAYMAQGLAAWDARGHLLISNSHYQRMMSLPDELVVPGQHFLAAARYLAQRGDYGPGDPDALAWQRYSAALQKGAVRMERRTLTGAILEIEVRDMLCGGFVATLTDVTAARVAEANAIHMAKHDALTGLPNRVLLHEHLTEVLASASAGGGRAAVLYMDLDRFKEVNDTLGHPVGDALLREAAERITRNVRSTREGSDLVARLGGDEFAVVLPAAFGLAADAAAEAAGLADRLIQVLAEPFDLLGHRVVVGSSIGIALFPADGNSANELLKNADLALYRAKHEGRGCHRFFVSEMDRSAQARRLLELELRRALSEPGNPEFELHYQPLVNIATRSVTGFEALLRWRHPDQGLISPAEFVPLAEEVGVIDALGEWVLRRACTEATTWPAPLRVAVNLSPLQFRGAGLVDVVSAALAESGLEPCRLELEITEGVLLRRTEETLATLHRLRGLGVRIALDDFGTGYSSLSYLRSFPFRQAESRSLLRAGHDVAKRRCSNHPGCNQSVSTDGK
jgi:diguanylate cyclase (GGDEF)-like protein